MNSYIVRSMLVVFMVSSSVPAQAGWFADLGSSISSTVSGWFSQSSDQSKKAVWAMGAVAVGLGAFFVYKFWKKRGGGNRPDNPGDRPGDAPQPGMGLSVPVGQSSAPISVVIDPVIPPVVSRVQQQPAPAVANPVDVPAKRDAAYWQALKEKQDKEQQAKEKIEADKKEHHISVGLMLQSKKKNEKKSKQLKNH